MTFKHISTKSSQEAAQIYNRTALSLNIPLNNDLNHRFFEVMAAGSPQIIFGNRTLLGPLQSLGDLPGIYWAKSLDELINISSNLLKNITKITYPTSSMKEYSIKELLRLSFV